MIKKKHAIIISVTTLLFVACSSIVQNSNLRLPKHLGLGITHKLRQIASGDEKAFMSKSYNTWDRLNIIENELLPLISTTDKFLFQKTSFPISVTDYLEKKESPAKLMGHLSDIIQKMYLVKSQILWLVQDKMKKVGIVNYVGLNVDEKAKKAFGTAKESTLTKLQEQYLQVLPGVYYLYGLVAHLYDEKDHKVFKNQFGFQALEGLNLITNKYFSKFLSNKTGLNMKRLTLPQNTQSLFAINDSNFQVNVLKYLEHFQGFPNKQIKEHFNTYSTYYQKFAGTNGTYANAIKETVKFDFTQDLPDMVSYSMGPEDKFLVEYLALKKPKDERQLAKINQFLAIREMMVNSWAIQRMTKRDQAEKINDCGDGLLAYKLWNDEKSTYAVDYLHTLWNQDLYLNTLDDFFNQIRSLLYSDSLIATGIHDGELNDSDFEKMLDKGVMEYQQFLVTLIRNPEKLGKLPRKLKEILSDPFFQEDLKGAKNPISAIADFFSTEDAVELEQKELKINKIDFINAVYSEDDLSGGRISAVLAMDAYSVRKRNLLKYFLGIFVGALETVKKYPEEDREFYITKKDLLEIETYFEKLIDKNWGSQWVEDMTAKIDEKLHPLLDNITQNNYDKKFQSLQNFLTKNIKHAILLTDYFKKNPRGKAKGAQRNKFPSNYSLPVTSPMLIQSIIIKDQIFCKHGACKRIDDLLFNNQYFAQELMSELSEKLQEKFRNSSKIIKMLNEDLSLAQEFEMTDEIWKILTSVLLDMKKEHELSAQEYQDVVFKYGDDHLFRNKIYQDNTRVAKLPIDPKLLKDGLSKEGLESENCSALVENDECRDLESSDEQVVQMSGEHDSKKENETSDYNIHDKRILTKNFQLHHIAKKLGFSDFDPKKGNQLIKSARIQELLAIIYIDKLLEIEPFFSTVIEEKTKEWGGNSKHTVIRDITFLKKFSKIVIGTKEIPGTSELKEIFATVVKDASYLGDNKEIKSFCHAKYSEYGTDDNFDKLFTKTKNIRERIIAQNPEINSANEEMRWKIEKVRVIYEKSMLYIGGGMIVMMIAFGGLAAIGFPFFSTIFTNLLFIKFTSYFFLGVMVYELGYGLLYLPPQLDMQRSIVSAHNLKTTKNMSLEHIYSIDTFDRIKKEWGQAKFDMWFAAIFAVTDLAALKLVYRQKMLAKAIPQDAHLLKVTRSERVRQNIRQNNEYYESLSRWKKQWYNIRKEYRWGNKTARKMTEKEIANITYDTLRHSVENSDVPYKGLKKSQFPGLENVDYRIKNFLHLVLEINKKMEVRFLNSIKGKWGIFSKGDLKKQLKKANQAIDNISSAVQKANPEKIAEMKAAIKKLDDLKVPEKFEITEREIGPATHQFIDEYLESMTDFFDVMYKNEKILPKSYTNKTITKSYKEFSEMAGLRVFSSESTEYAIGIIKKNPEDIGKYFDEWMETVVNKSRKKVDGSDIDVKKIVDEVVTSRTPAEFIFEMFLETSWDAAKIKYAKRKPDSFLASIFDEVRSVREIKETVTSLYRQIYIKKKARTARIDRVVDQLILNDIQKVKL